MAETDGSIVLLAGASGLTGTCVLNALLDAPDVSRVIAVSRRPLPREHARLANRIVPFERLEEQLRGTSCHAALCCLGTTLRKAGSAERFRAVDLDLVLAFARAARAAGARRFVFLSSVGANATSRNLYLRTKGEAERALEALGFESLAILQPSLLLGWRREMRPLELIGVTLMPLVNPLLRGKHLNARGIPARMVAAAMLGALRSGRRGVQRYTFAGLEELSRISAPRARPPAPAKASAGAR